MRSKSLLEKNIADLEKQKYDAYSRLSEVLVIVDAAKDVVNEAEKEGREMTPALLSLRNAIIQLPHHRL